MVSSRVSKLGLGLLLSTAILAGCSTTTDSSSTDDANANSTASSSGVSQNSGLNGFESENLSNVFYFELDQSSLTQQARQALTMHAQQLAANPRSIRLEGHADERGSREYNMALGERRALAVREYLVLNGVNGSTIEVVSYGEEQPAAYGQGEASYQQNRRVELK